jgi:type IV pilus assembly protein PilA
VSVLIDLITVYSSYLFVFFQKINSGTRIALLIPHPRFHGGLNGDLSSANTTYHWRVDVMLNMKRVEKGFTLIELMIVIAIVAILVALAVPAYKDYTIRTKVGECVNGAAVPKLAISEYRESSSPTAWPATAAAAAVAAPAGSSQYCTGFTAYASGTGLFQINVDETAVGTTAGNTIQPQLKPFDNGQGGVDWVCSDGGTATAAIKYLPSTCRGADT